MATFAKWLADQAGRQDGVGEVARHWAQFGVPKVHALASVQKHLESSGALEGPMAGYLADAAAEFRAGRGSVPVHSVGEPQASGGALERIERKLDLLVGLLTGDGEMVARLVSELAQDAVVNMAAAGVIAPLDENAQIALGGALPPSADPAVEEIRRSPQEALRGTAAAGLAQAQPYLVHQDFGQLWRKLDTQAFTEGGEA